MDQSIASANAHRPHWTVDDVRRAVEENRIVVFAKGTKSRPRCGFSERIISAMTDSGRPFEVIDVCEDRSIIAALKMYAGRKYVPLVYVDGLLLTTSETIEQVVQSGELRAKLEAAFGQ